MQRFFFLLFISLGVLTSSAQIEKLVPLPDMLFIYEEQFDAPIQQDNRCFIVLWKDSLGLHGRMNATTDEFYTAREGYLPGYEIRPLKNIVVRDSLLSFEVDPGVAFDNPVPLYCKDEAEARRSGIPLWVQKYTNIRFALTHRYTGVIRSDRFITAEGEPFVAPTAGWKRTFIRCN